MFKNEREIEQGVMAPLSDAEMATMDNYSPQKMCTQNVVGLADEVIARLRHYEKIGLHTIQLLDG